MARNQFEQVDEPQPDAMTLLLRQGGEGETEPMGSVFCPRSASASLPKDYDSGPLPAVEAFRSALKLANTLQVAIVVVDPQGVWQQQWGDLLRDVVETADEEGVAQPVRQDGSASDGRS